MTYPGNLVGPKELYSQVEESVFQRDIIKAAKRLNFEVYSHNTVGARCPQCSAYVNRGRIVTSKGWPDLCIGRADPPRLIFAELKKKGAYLTQDQKRWKAILEANGVEFYTLRPADYYWFIETILEDKFI